MTDEALGASFRDPGGYVFEREGVLLRRVLPPSLPGYEALMTSGLYPALVGEGLLTPHEEVESSAQGRTLAPVRVDFVSDPYEWSFSQLRDAGLTTLRVQRTAMRFGMTLEDASAYNVPLPRVADFFADRGEALVVEFVPKSDPKLRTLLATREDVFPDYTREGFEAAFARRFEPIDATLVEGSERILDRMRRRA